MKMEFLVENRTDHKVYDISDLVTGVTWSDELNNGCSKLDFSYIDDTLKIGNGSIVKFSCNNKPIFYGFVFKSKEGTKREVQVTAYDQLRYLKAKDTIVVKDMTMGALLKRACEYFKLKWGNVADTKYKLPTSIQEDKTWLDIFYTGISDTFMGTGKKYCLYDDFGNISLGDLETLRLPLILGDESLCYDYDYEKSIDDQTYNLIKIARDNEKTGRRDVFSVEDTNSFKRFGMLQYFEKQDKKLNDSQIKAKADELLKFYNREKESLSLKCIGDVRVRAGSGIIADIKALDIHKYLLVNKVKHSFKSGSHTMDLELIL